MKQMIKHILALLLCTVMLCGALPVAAGAAEIIDSGSCGKNLTWTLSDAGKLTISGTGPMADYHNPTDATGVAGAAPWYTKAAEVKSVVIKKGVTSIGDWAFCEFGNLTSIKIPSSVTRIGAYALCGCTGLKSIDLPDSITTFGEAPFWYCGLTSVEIPKGITNISEYAFAWCGNLKEITFHDAVKTIGSHAFHGCSGLTNIVLPEGLTSIGDGAFFFCHGLTSITIPESLTGIGGYAFVDCHALTDIYITDLVDWVHIHGLSNLMNCNFEQKRIFLDGTLVEGKLVIPEGARYIAMGAFMYCKDITSVTLPKTVTVIDNDAFMDCDGLTSVKLSKNLEHISGQAFFGCEKLKSITIPDSVVYIGDYAFGSCTSLTKFSIGSGVASIGKCVLYGCNKLTGVQVAEDNPVYCTDSTGSLYAKDETALLWVPQGLSGTFKVPERVTEISYGLFEGCSKLEKVVLPDGLEVIDHYAFDGCTSLTDINVPESVYRIGQQAFAFCYGLTSMVIPDGVTELDGTFLECTGLTSVKIPDSVTTMICTFERCYNLKKVNLPKGLTEIGDNTFINCKSLTSIKIPDSVTRIGTYAFLGCSKLKTVTWPKGLVELGETAFGSCNKLTNVVLPASVRSLPDYVFSECNDLESIIFEGDAPMFASTCFWGVTTTAYYPAGNATWTDYKKQDYRGNITWKEKKMSPAAPEIEVNGIDSSGKNKVSWDKVDHAEEYQVYRATSKSGTYKKLTTTSKTSYTDKSAEAGKKYYYKVRAVAEDGTKSAYSNIKARTCDLARPVVEESNVTSSGAIKLEWKKIEGAEKYKIYRWVGKSGDYEYYKSTTKNSYTDNNTVPGKVYYYKVLAVHNNTSANSAQSSGVGQTCKLAQPVVEESNVTSSGAIKLEWKKIEGAEKYKIYRRVGKSGDYEYFKSTTGNQYTDKDTIPGTVYYYKVLAAHSNSSANSAKSSGVGQTCKLAQPDVSVKLSSDYPKLTWDKVEGAKKYKVYRAVSEDGKYTSIKTTTSLKYTDKSAEEGVTYYYKVKAIHANSSANSAYSSIDSIEVPRAACTEHSWSEWIVTQEPTTEAEGQETRTCSTCGATETRAVNKLPEETEPDEPTVEDYLADSHYSDEAITYINEYRAAHGLPALRVDHSDFVLLRAAELRVSFSHTRPNGGYIYEDGWASECIAGGTNAKSVIDGWYNSTGGHKETMLNASYTVACVAYNGTCWVLLVA